MILRVAGLSLTVLLVIGMAACRDKGRNAADSARASLPAVYPVNPVGSTNWDVDAGPVMIISRPGNGDSVGIVLPEATDSTIESLQGISPPISGLTFDLFGRGGRIASSIGLSLLPPIDVKQECDAWPLAKLRSAHSNWRIGFASGHVSAIALDSIEVMPSADSAALAASLAQMAATLPIVSDPTFRGLPFRVRSAYTFRLDSIDLVIADVVRSVNEEANPRVEHLLIVGEQPAGAKGKYNLGYYSRTAGAEESTQATEMLAAVQIGATKRPAIVINIEYDEGGKLGLIERTDSGEWRATWNSAYTDC
jgi:hypothetical protein